MEFKWTRESVKRCSIFLFKAFNEPNKYGGWTGIEKEIERFLKTEEQGYNRDIDISYLDKVKHPLFTTEDGVAITDEEQRFYGVLAECDWTKCEFNFRMIKKADVDWKFFSTQDARDEYILMNKPILSLNEILDAYNKTSSYSPDVFRHSNLFKQFIKAAKKSPVFL